MQMWHRVVDQGGRRCEGGDGEAVGQAQRPARVAARRGSTQRAAATVQAAARTLGQRLRSNLSNFSYLPGGGGRHKVEQAGRLVGAALRVQLAPARARLASTPHTTTATHAHYSVATPCHTHSRACEISTTRSARKLNTTTASPSCTAPTDQGWGGAVAGLAAGCRGRGRGRGRDGTAGCRGSERVERCDASYVCSRRRQGQALRAAARRAAGAAHLAARPRPQSPTGQCTGLHEGGCVCGEALREQRRGGALSGPGTCSARRPSRLAHPACPPTRHAVALLQLPHRLHRIPELVRRLAQHVRVVAALHHAPVALQRPGRRRRRAAGRWAGGRGVAASRECSRESSRRSSLHPSAG